VRLDVGDEVYVTPRDSGVHTGSGPLGAYRGKVTSTRRDGSYGVQFQSDQGDLPVPPECPLTAEWHVFRTRALGSTSGDTAVLPDPLVAALKACPFGSQLHGLFEARPGELYLLLRDVDWRPCRRARTPDPNKIWAAQTASASDVVRTRADLVISEAVR